MADNRLHPLLESNGALRKAGPGELDPCSSSHGAASRPPPRALLATLLPQSPDPCFHFASVAVERRSSSDRLGLALLSRACLSGCLPAGSHLREDASLCFYLLGK